MSKPKINLKYALGEILIVVIGIFIAFELQNFKEKITENKERVGLIKSFIGDLKRDSVIFENVIKFDSIRAAQLKTLINLTQEDDKDYDSIKSIISGGKINTYQVDLSNHTTYDLYKNSGKATIINNDSIERTIGKYYEMIQPFYRSWREYDEEIDDDFDRSQVNKRFREIRIKRSILMMNGQNVPDELTKEYIDLASKDLIQLEFDVERQNAIKSMMEAMKKVFEECLKTKNALEDFLDQIN